MTSASLLRHIAVIGMIGTQWSCTTGDGSPFPSRFELVGSNKFEFTATGNFVYPSNTKEGEAKRIAWLSGHISQQHICSSGYVITSREVDLSKLSVKHTEQRDLSITYLGECKAQS